MTTVLNILFVSSGDAGSGTKPIILNQGTSIAAKGHKVQYFNIKGSGIAGYIKSIVPLRKAIKREDFDIIHAHYSFSGFVCSLTMTNIPIIVSLMGSDVLGNRWIRPVIKLFSRYSWNRTIVKSHGMKKYINNRSVHVIPNGVNLRRFKPLNKISCQQQIDWKTDKKHVLFAANPSRYEKNFTLVEKAMAILNRPDVILHTLKNIPNDQVPLWINAADVVVLSSFWEGSPNVIKEAMACNCPVVSTNVGDVKETIDDTSGCFFTSYDPADVAEKLKMALHFDKHTSGREKVLHLDDNIIAEKILEVYKSMLE